MARGAEDCDILIGAKSILILLARLKSPDAEEESFVGVDAEEEIFEEPALPLSFAIESLFHFPKLFKIAKTFIYTSYGVDRW